MDIHGMYLDQNTGQPRILTQIDKEQKKKDVTISKSQIYKKCKKVIYQCKENFRENRKSINLGLILILDYLSFGAGSYFLATGLDQKWVKISALKSTPEELALSDQFVLV